MSRRNESRGAGGTSGGLGRFLMGLVMMIGGGYLFLNSIRISNSFGLGYSLYRVGRFGITSGMVLIPFVFGVGMVFYDSKNIIGWFLGIGSLIMLFFGIISSINFRFAPMSAFDFLVILVLMVGGAGLFLSSLKPQG